MKTNLKPKNFFISLIKLVTAVVLPLTLIGNSQAAPRTWSGGGADNNWSTAANWGGTAPVNGDSLIFAGSTRTTNLNNIASFSVSGITFNNSLFLFGGNFVTNTGGIYDNAGNNTNNLVMYLNGSQGITNAVVSSVLQLGGINTNMGTGNILTYGGPGSIFVAGVLNGRASVNINGDGAGGGLVRFSAANLFVGPLSINSGTLMLANAAAIPSGNGNGDVTNNATIDLNGNSQTINGLFGNSSGIVDNKTGTATYTLTVGNNATNTGGAFEFDGTIVNTLGSVALTKVNTNTFFLNGGSDTYAGNTAVNAGKLILGASATLPNTPVITVAQGAQLDVSSQATFAIGASQALYAGRTTNGGPNDVVGSLDNSGKLVVLNPAAAGTLNLGGNLTLESGSTITFDLGNTNTAGSGSNDLVTINGALGLNGGTIQLNPISGSLATGANGIYTLITNKSLTATETGTAANLTVAVPRGVTATLNDTTYPGSLLVAITGSGVPVSLVWNGASGANWDVQSTQDWLNGVTADYFYYLDNVVFNDVGNGNVNVATGVSPSSTVFSNTSTNAYTLSGSGAISGSGSLKVINGGSVVLNTGNNYTGDTIVTYGNLLLGNYIAGGINYAVYNAVTPANLVLGNGNVFQIGIANQQEYSVFNSLVLNPGGSSLSMRNRQSSDLPYYQFNNNITRNPGGTLDINNPAGKAGSKAGVYFGSNIPLLNGIIGGYATWVLNDWLTTNNVVGTQATGFVGYQTNNTPSAWISTSNVVITASTTANINTATINSLKIPAAATATINAGQTLTLSSGGILIPNNSSGSATITGGTLQGAANADLILLENSTANALTIASTIADNGGATALTKAGQGTLILSGANTYSGATFINGQTMNGANNSAAPIPLFAAGTLQVGAGGTVGDLGNSTIVTNYGTLAYNHSDNVTLSIPVVGPGGLKQLGGGVLTLTGANTYSGLTTISAGTLQVGTGGTAGTVGSTTGITDNGALVINHSDAFSISAPISGSGSLVKLGGNNLALNSSNSYAGLTVISNGTVTVGAAGSISQSAGIVMSSGSTLDVSAVSPLFLTGGTIAQVLAGNGTVNGSLVVTNNTRVTPGTNSVVGSLTINNNLTLAGGTLNIDVGSSTKDTITVGGTLALNAGSLVLKTLNTLPNGIYKLIGYNSFSGDVANLAFSGFVQSGQLAYITNNATGKELDLVVYNGAGAALVWVGDGVNNFWDVNGSSDWNNGSGASVFHNNDNVTLDDTSVNPTVNLNASVAPATITVNTLANNYVLTGAGKITGGASMTVNATNTTLTITTPNDNSGVTTINTGTVQVGDGSTVGNIGIGVVTNKGTINFNEPVDTLISASLAGSGSIFQQGSTVLNLIGDNSAFNGPITISSGVVDVGASSGSGSLGSGPVTNNGTLLVDRTGSLTINNNITGSGAVAFINGGTVTYGGNNTYANNTYISNGVVKLGSSSALYSDGSAGDWLVLDGGASTAGTLDLNGYNATVNALQGLNGTVNGVILNSVSGVTNTLTINGTATTSYSGAIKDNSGTGGKVALFVSGGAVQTLDIESLAGNSFTGGTTVSNASLHLVSSAVAATANFPNPICLGTGPITLLAGGAVYAPGSANGNPTWGSLANTLIVPTNQSGTVYGPQRGNVAISPIGSGTLTYITTYVRDTINGNWSGFTGQIIFGNATLGGQLGIANTAGFGHVFCTNAAGSGGVTLYNTVAGTPTIPIGELADDGTTFIESTSSGNAGGVAANFAVGGLNTSTNFGGGIIDNVGIIKVGTGSWTLTSASLTYSGLTTVSNGVLVLGASATLPNSTPITLVAPGKLDVSAAGTFALAHALQGNGTLNGSLDASATASTVSPGGANSIGTLTVTNAVILGGTITMELNRTNTPGSNDLLVAASVVAGGTLQVNNLGADLHTGDTFKLFSVPVAGTFAVTNLPVTTGNGLITYVWTNNVALDGTIKVLVGVPNVNTTPTNIVSVVNGNNLELSWPADHKGWRLQSQTNTLSTGLSANWVDVSGSINVNSVTNPINPANGSVFYRMIYP